MSLRNFTNPSLTVVDPSEQLTMPTTRSRKRPSEALASLPDTTRKPRKKRILSVSRNLPVSPEPREDHRPSARDDNFLAVALGPDAIPSIIPAPHAPSNPSYTHATAQTVGKWYVLTHMELDTMVEEAVERKLNSNKRSRDEEDEQSTPSAKRINFASTPNLGYGFLFNKPPNTAPAKTSLASSSTPSRVIRGPISSRNITPISRRRRTPLPNIASKSQITKQRPVQLKPVDLAPTRSDSEPASARPSTDDSQRSESHSNFIDTQPAQRGLFGSLRGLAQSGFDFAMNLSPRRVRSISPQLNPAIDSTNRFSSDRDTPEDNDERIESVEQDNDTDNSNSTSAVRQQDHQSQSTNQRPMPSTEPRRSRYDHLHYVKPGSDEERRLAAGEWVPPPRAPTPPDEFEVTKKRHPDMPDWMIRNLLAKRAKRRTMREEASGAESAPPKIAPLFGPDSHYARGTVDPRFVSPRAYRMHAKYPNLIGGSAGSKRPFDVFESDQTQADQEHQPTVEDMDEGDLVEEDEVQQDDATIMPDTPLAKKQKTAFPSTPRSALKKQNDFGGSIGRSGRSVNFNANPVSGSRGLRAHYGPAGQYKGSTFADLSSPTSQDESSLSTLSHEDMISPSTKLNTLANMGASKIDAMLALEKNLGAEIPDIDFTLRDPNNDAWRPSLTNPRPGCFRVPDLDEEDMLDEEDENVATNSVPPQPSTPRMSHAELPSTSVSQDSNGTSFNESSIQFESTELAIEKARSKAQKYKPKDSSRLSEVSLSHSRSPSPESENTPRAIASSAPAVKAVGTPIKMWSQRKPYVETPLDNVKRGEDGMTDFEREHQYDDWAAGLDWGSAQTYEDAGTGTKEIHNLIRKNWTEEDSRRSEEFWQKEFDEIDLLQKKAKAKKQMLQFITGMEDAEEFME